MFVSGEPRTPGHRYRVERHARAAADNGFRTTVLDLEQVSSALDVLDENVAFVVLWRLPWDTRVRRVIEKARCGGATIIFDVDDLMTVARFATVELIDGIRTQGVDPLEAAGFFSRILRTARACDACCCTTDSLAGWLRMEGLMTFVIPNGFDEQTLMTSQALAARSVAARGKPVRIGYGAGSLTHQQDFRVAAPALARVLREHSHCRLVLFEGCLDVSEFEELAGLEQQIEWRRLVPLEQLPAELARFDVNIAPLQLESPFCDAKSPLKYFEAALVDVPTIASPTSPYRDAIAHQSTGLLARTESEWYEALTSLVNDGGLRRRLALGAYVDVLWRFGPRRRAQLVGQMYRQLDRDPRVAAEAFQLAHLASERRANVESALDFERVFDETDTSSRVEVTVIVPVHNYAQFLHQALESVARQTLAALDLVIVDDASTDDSLQVATSWARLNRARFGRIAVLRFPANAGVAAARNLGFVVSRTPYALPLDADNVLLPECSNQLLAAIHRTGAGFAFPRIRHFGEASAGGQRGFLPYHAQRLVGSNYIDAMALVSLEAWAAAGGYQAGLLGWEDYDLWCGIAERGMFGVQVDTELALYREHDRSMTQGTTETHAGRVREIVRRRHGWVQPHPVLPTENAPARSAARRAVHDLKRALSRISRLRRSAPDASSNDRQRLVTELLRCPRDLGRLLPSNTGLRCRTCAHVWPVVHGCPVLFEGLRQPHRIPNRHLSNPIPGRGEAMIEAAGGWVLNLSAGGTQLRREHVVELEASIFRHTDVVADAHRLPFDDSTFEAVIALNCFEHFHSPALVAAEISRVLRPGGSVLIHTAFLQPLHEEPGHFYNTTSFGLRRWFSGFEIDHVSVTDNFSPIYALSWTAADILECLGRDASEESAAALGATTLTEAAAFWLEPSQRSHPRWAPLAALSDASRERTAAGFELLARLPR